MRIARDPLLGGTGDGVDMGDHEDEFCPACGANVGPGTLDVIGCPLCGYEPDDDDDSLEDEED